jgi:hypothetical protein
MGTLHWLTDVKEYISKHYKDALMVFETAASYKVASYIQQRRSPGFSEQLLHFVDSKGFEDTEVYKRAGLDRKLFSKIRSNPAYQPGKKTAFALCLSLHLTIQEAEILLRSAGYSFSNSHVLDLIVRYCIEHQIYNLHEVNFALDHYGLEPL